MELWSLHTLRKMLKKGLGVVWCYLLQPVPSCPSMGDSSALGGGQEGLATLIVLGMEHPLVAPVRLHLKGYNFLIVKN